MRDQVRRNILEMEEIFGDLLRDFYSIRWKGKKVQFSLKPGEHTYRYYRGKSGVEYCYTPHPSTEGDYFVWNYVPIGKGSRSGQATRFRMKKLVRCARRKTAREKALARYRKEQEESR